MSVRQGRLYTSSNSGSTWTERKPDGIDVDREWKCVASDSDGSNLIAGEYSTGHKGRLYISSNSGVSWTERQPAGNNDKLWRCVASDSTGSVLIACVNGGRVYISTNSGVSWNETQPNGNVNGSWQYIDCDSDGSFIIISDGNQLWVSSNTGSSWTEISKDIILYGTVGTDPAPCWGVACDSTGANLLIIAYWGLSRSQLYTSANSGATWTERLNSENLYWYYITSDSDGSFLTAIATDRMFKSSNSGVDWTRIYPTTYDCPFASDSDGSYLIGCRLRVYLSSDSGANWTQTQPEGNVTESWQMIDCDSTGTNVIICSFHYEVPPKKKLCIMGYF